MLEIETETILEERAEFIRLRGHVMSHNVAQLDAVCQQAMNQSRYYLLLDMSDCDYISSAGISLLLQVASQCRRWNRGDLWLIRPTEFVRNVLHLTDLLSDEHSHFMIYEELSAGLHRLESLLATT
jgi:anti-anti-sigma factor